MIFLGIDISLVNTGCIKLLNGYLKNKQSIKSKKTSDKPIDELNRMLNIRDSIDMTGVGYVAIEGIAFAARNTTSMSQLSALNYMVREYAMLCGCKFIIVAPTTLKKFVTGKGNVGKDVMMLETYKRYGESFSDNNLADAYGLARCAEAVFNTRVKLTKFQQEVVDLLRKQL